MNSQQAVMGEFKQLTRQQRIEQSQWKSHVLQAVSTALQTHKSSLQTQSSEVGTVCFYTHRTPKNEILCIGAEGTEEGQQIEIDTSALVAVYYPDTKVTYMFDNGEQFPCVIKMCEDGQTAHPIKENEYRDLVADIETASTSHAE